MNKAQIYSFIFFIHLRKTKNFNRAVKIKKKKKPTPVNAITETQKYKSSKLLFPTTWEDSVAGGEDNLIHFQSLQLYLGKSMGSGDR